MSHLKDVQKKGLISCNQSYVVDQLMYEVIMGSFAYGVSSDSSDMDIYGFCIPNRSILFPHTVGIIQGFGNQGERFDQWQQHHVLDKNALNNKGRVYDFSIYSIVKYFQLCMENNPNMIDSLFVPQRCVLTCTSIGNMVRENRKIFLHRGAWHKFKGYSFAQLHKLETKNPIGKRKEQLDENKLDRKYLYHLVRLMGEIEQILIEGDIDLERNREQLKAIRRGEQFTGVEEVYEWFNKKESELETLYNNCTVLPYRPREDEIRELLLNCLEHHFGSLDKMIIREDTYAKAISDIRNIIGKLH